MAAEPQRNSFRAAVIRGERPTLVVTDKAPRLDRSHEAETLDGVVPRSEARRGDHRGKDRHRLSGETATARYGGEEHEVELINLSAGGAMIRAAFAPRLWDMVELELGGEHRIECAVRWLRNGLVGLEFAHETQIDCDPEARAALLLDVINRSFPDSPVQLEKQEAEDSPAEPGESEHRLDKRHPLIWNGVLHCGHRKHPVRLRNISTGGALVDVECDYVAGAEVLLDIGDAGNLAATVSWSRGGQAGLRFAKPFDLAALAKARPEVTPHHWVKPSFLDKPQEDDSPWHSNWSRSSISEIRSELEGFLKR